MPPALTSSPTRAPRRTRRAAPVLALAAALPALAACGPGRPAVTGSVYPNDYRDRHPIALADAPRVLDVFVEGRGGLPLRERQDVASFLGEHQRYGNSPLFAQVPLGTENAAGTRAALAGIRDAAGGRLHVSTYRPADPTVASPIRLSFKRLQAKVASKCGLWPQDLGTSNTTFNFENQQYWNLGCAYQSNLASQVADPVDLVRGRREDTPDTVRRMNNIGKLRAGQDPSTTYRQQETTVNSSIAQ